MKSNSQFRKGFLNGEAFRSRLGLQQSLLHRLAVQEIRCLPFRFDFPPEFNGDNHTDGITIGVGDELKIDDLCHDRFSIQQPCHRFVNETVTRPELCFRSSNATSP